MCLHVLACMCDWSSCDLVCRMWLRTVAFESICVSVYTHVCVKHPRSSLLLMMLQKFSLLHYITIWADYCIK